MSSLFSQYQLLAHSRLFDTDYYRAAYPDVVASGIDPLLHYIERGAQERRVPHPAFDVDFYLEQCAEDGEAPTNALLHFLESGRARGLRASRVEAARDSDAGECEISRSATAQTRERTTSPDNTGQFKSLGGLSKVALFINSPVLSSGVAVAPAFGALLIKGWAGSPDRVLCIEVGIDAAPAGFARLGLQRPDVKAEFPGWCDAEWSGFAATVMMQNLPPGPCCVSLTALDSAGNSASIRFAVVQQRHSPEALLESAFLDERSLFRALGLRRADVGEFTASYLRIPPAERPSLSPFFDVKWYNEAHQELALSGVDPFEHFCVSGVYCRYAPHPLVDLDAITTQNPFLLERGVALSNLRRFLTNNEGRFSPYFDLDYYLDKRPDAQAYPTGALGHFMECNAAEILIPNKFFDPSFYMDRYPDVPQSEREAFLHFVAYGDAQYRFPSAAFDPDWYRVRNEDVKLSGMPPLRHFLEWGQLEGRVPRARNLAFGTIAPAGGQSQPVESFTPDIAGGRERYLSLRALINDRKAARIQSIGESECRVAITTDFGAELAKVHFKALPEPLVSIIIPFYNELPVTLECLRSISICDPNSRFEIILADDCSTDPAWEMLSRIPGVRYIRQERNINFLRNCNSAFAQARGEYIFLFNSDAQVLEGAIDFMVNALQQDATLGAVGPQLLFPNGRLQEAGCAVRRDASSVMVGVMENPGQPRYQYARDVDYISGAALMFRRSLAREELFDPDLAPAYCEDLELCLDIKAKGFRIRYIPEAKVVHHLSMTMSDHGKKMMRIRTNQQKVVEKWGDALSALNRVRVIAFYLPQFHPIPENDLWWGTGFTEWTNVSKAAPSYAGHYQPRLPSDLGFYDLRLPDTLRKQAELIRTYDLGGICLYYYNFGGKRFLGRPLELLLENPDIDLPFCLCWANENWSRRWDGGSRDLLLEQMYDGGTLSALAADVATAALDPRYIRVEGKPLFLIYRPLLIPRVVEAVTLIRDVARSHGCGELQMVFVESMEAVNQEIDPIELGFDASVEFPPQGFAVAMKDQPEIFKDGWDGLRYDYEATIQDFIFRPGVAWPRYPAVFPSWDNTPRQPLNATSFDRCSPEAFQVYAEEKIEECRAMLSGDNRLLFVNAWNEWAEGACLEPDRAYGHRWLEALRTALLRKGCI